MDGERFGLERGLVTTVHAYTNDQRILDLPHKDLRRARAAATNIIPTSTGAARTCAIVLTEHDGKSEGKLIGIPSPAGSVVDLVANLKKKAELDQKAAVQKYQIA